jgi:glycosyltransferase involved in cell wall biosynthesis
MRLLQIARRPEITGGSVGCAWTICQALPDWSHVLFCCSPGEVPEPIRDAFAGHRLLAGPMVTAAVLRAAAPDVIFLHNVTDEQMAPELLADVPAFFYCHGSYSEGFRTPSAGLMATSTRVFCVSEFLAGQLGFQDGVWYQPVSSPPAGGEPRTRQPLVVGRLCNPRRENWPASLAGFYRRLASWCPYVRWEFVGCPAELRSELDEACGGGAVFHEAGLAARGHLRRWHAMLYHTEVIHAYGRTICEAQQAGCVPVVDRRGGFVEQIDSGRTGYLCETVDHFAAALGELRDAERRRTLALAACEAGDHRGSLERWRRRFLQLCREPV